MKKLTEYSMPYRELYACHEALRRLGFVSDDIYVELVGVANHPPPNDNVLCMILRAQDKSFTINIAQMNHDEDVLSVWNECIKRVAVAPEYELNEIWENSIIFKSSMSLLTTLTAKGFTFPKSEEEEPIPMNWEVGQA